MRHIHHNAPINSRYTAIVRSIIMLGQNIGVGTTAEGIETEDQLVSVVTEGCTLGQGYLFSRPLTADDASTFINEYTKLVAETEVAAG